VPPQHKPIAGEEVLGFGEFVESAHHSAESFFIKDVKALEGSAWRWTHAEPEFRFFVKSAQRRVFRLDMAISDVTFRDTGPVRLAVRINGQLLDEPVFDKPGNHLYEKAVPASLLKENAENRVVVEVKNPWNAPDPGVRLGFLLYGVGFVSR
jgi:hypothetical protein